MLKPLLAKYLGKDETFYCHHWRVFPPITALMDIGVEDQRAQKLISNAEYERHKVWERMCGLDRGMDEDICLKCPHIRRLEDKGPNIPPDLVSLDGLHRFPVVDSVDIASRGHSRTNYTSMTQGTRSAKLAGQRRDEGSRPKTRSDG